MPLAHAFRDFACFFPLLSVRCDLGVDVVADEGAETVVLGFVVEGGTFWEGELREEGL